MHLRVDPRLLRTVLLTAAALAVSVFLALTIAWQQLNSPLSVAAPVNFEIAPGTSLRAIADDLALKGHLDDPLLFSLWSRITGDASRIQAGEYELAPGMTPRTLLARLVSGQVLQYQITLVEGWTFNQALEAIWRSPGTINTLELLAPSEIAARLELAWSSPEGLLFPDTYNYTRGTTDSEILTRAYNRLMTILVQEWEARVGALPYDSMYAALIMASIVEKETALASERTQIAGVFVRRLERNMRLQSDPTVIYGMGARYDGNIDRNALNEITPYNTYRVAGLPPTPIALAGREALRASLNPDASSALYFVSRGDGSHQFSETLEQHNAAVRRYQIGQSEAQQPQDSN